MIALAFAVALFCANGVGVGPVEAPGAGGTGPVAPAVTALALAPDAPHAIVGRADGSLHRVEVGGDQDPVLGEPAWRLDGAVVGVAFGRGGVAYAIDDAGHVAALEPGRERRLLGRHEGGAQGLALAADGKTVATAGNDGAIGLFATATDFRGEIRAHEGPVAAVAFAGDRLVSAGWDGTVRSFKLSGLAGKAESRHVLGTRELTALAAAPKGSRLVVAGFDGVVAILDAAKKSAAPQKVLARAHGEWARAVAVSPDGARAVIVASAESVLLVVDLDRPGDPLAIEQTVAPSTATFTPDGRALIVGRFDGTLVRVPLAASPGNGRKP